MQDHTKDAATIASDLLERSGNALMSGDFQAFADCFNLPQQFETYQGPQCAETLDDLRRVFDQVRAHFACTGVTDMARTVVHAEFKGQDIVEAVHESRLLSRNTLLRGPYPVFSTIKRTDGVWKVDGASYAITNDPQHERALSTRKLQKSA